ncbi:MAG TPA: hypothetical protein DCP20_05425 [Coriobacteriia bacterium]|nr:MAG: hypothetical protein XD74_0492 [Actinobacteria bacterium 66_15]HAL30139.1 hypothetical protein [Coriobacteriia bacterium]
MREIVTDRRMALAAPLMHVLIVSTLLVLVSRPADLVLPALAALLAGPTAIGLWVFAGRPPLSRMLLATWAPAGGAVLFVASIALVRVVGDAAQGVLAMVVAGPLALLLAFSARRLRGQGRRTVVIAAVMWVAALAETVAAVPLVERFGGPGGMASLAGTVTLLFAPSVALGAWAGLAVAALIPEPGAPDVPVGEDGMDAPSVEASSREVTG